MRKKENPEARRPSRHKLMGGDIKDSVGWKVAESATDALLGDYVQTDSVRNKDTEGGLLQ